jgi:BirA family biotin operon repressor/biotin-[acetyl-CoA-carboxylase] ligase
MPTMERTSISGPVAWLGEVDSTNRHARDGLAQLADGTLVVASGQTAGRGRRGRAWVSPPGVNLYATFVMKGWSQAPTSATWLAALATLDLLREVASGADWWIKWPNDLYCGGARKAGGILCESLAAGVGQCDILAGIGVNLNMTPEQLAAIPVADGSYRPTSVLAETGRVVDVKACAAKLAAGLTAWREEVRGKGIGPLFRRWREESRIVGREVRIVTDDGSACTGTVADLAPDGALILAIADGSRRPFHGGDVSLRPA